MFYIYTRLHVYKYIQFKQNFFKETNQISTIDRTQLKNQNTISEYVEGHISSTLNNPPHWPRTAI